MALLKKSMKNSGIFGVFVWAVSAQIHCGPPVIPPPVDAGQQCRNNCNAIGGATLPSGFCIREYARIGQPRSIVVAPNGDLFVASPALPSAGGASAGSGQIIVLSDDDDDGVSTMHTFAAGITDVHGVALTATHLYYTTSNGVFRTPYTMGQRAETPNMREQVSTFPSVSGARWTHGLGVSSTGAVYTSQGVYSSAMCPDTPRDGTVSEVTNGTLLTRAQGLRNPMYLRCHFADNVCLAAELGDDGGRSYGAREKLISFGSGAAGQYGFPCCASTNVTSPYNGGRFDCANVTESVVDIPLNDTPFGLDWERGRWPAAFRGGLFVALHGSFYSSPQWAAAAIVYAPTDPNTHLPTGQFQPFLTGFGPSGGPLERPADVAFDNTGRMYFTDDHAGVVYFVAPQDMCP